MNLDPWNIFTASFGQVPKPYTAFVTLLDMAMYFIISFNVGRARKKYKVEPPVTEGPVGFLKVLRVQANTVEQLAQHLPILWIAAYAMDDVFAAALGFIWLFGRCLYAIRYYQKASRRHKGFAIAMLANIVLFLGALVGTIAAF